MEVDFRFLFGTTRKERRTLPQGRHVASGGRRARHRGGRGHRFLPDAAGWVGGSRFVHCRPELRRLWESGVESLNNWLTATRTPSDRRLISKPLSRQVTRTRGVSLRRKSHDGGSHRKTSAEPMKERDGERRQAERGAGTSPGGAAGATPARGQEPPEGEGDAGGASEPGCSTFPF